MARRSLKELLSRAPLFAAMPPQALEAVAAHTTRQTFRRGQKLRKLEEAALVVLLTGRLDVVESTSGRTRVVRSLIPPELAGLPLEGSAELRGGIGGEVVIIPTRALLRVFTRYPDTALATVMQLRQRDGLSLGR
jgi:hypothetical protein